jgi:hypothetical protein
MLRLRSGVVLVVCAVLFASGCGNLDSRVDSASGDHDGLTLDARMHATSDSLVVETTVHNTRAEAVHLDADQCGRVTEVILLRTNLQPEGATYAGSLDSVKRLILRQQRSDQFPDGFAPRVVTGGSATPDCVRPTQPVELAAGGSIAERWELAFGTAFALETVGSEHASVRAEAVESVAGDKLGFLDILPAGDADADRAGRNVVVTRPASVVLDRPPTRPDTGPSLGQLFDTMVEDGTVRDFITAQPSDSWRDARFALAGPVVFKAITSGFERALSVTLTADGSVTGVSLPGVADRIRFFERRPATLPPGIAVIPEPGTPVPTEDVIAGRLSLPSGQLVADAYLGAGGEPLSDLSAAGDYPVFVTVARHPDSRFDEVAFATVAVSDSPTVSWARRSTIAVDGGTAAFTSAEGLGALKRLGATGTGGTDVLDQAFDSLTAHDGVITELPIEGGLDLAMFTSGYGDGGYDVYVGLDRDGKPTRFVIDFAIVHLGWPAP